MGMVMCHRKAISRPWGAPVQVCRLAEVQVLVLVWVLSLYAMFLGSTETVNRPFLGAVPKGPLHDSIYPEISPMFSLVVNTHTEIP